MIQDIALPQSFTVRSPRMEDLRHVFALINASDAAENNAGSTTEETLRSTWQNPAFHSETDAWIVADPSGQFVAYAALRNRSNVYFYLNPRLHPQRSVDFHSSIRAYLMHQAETSIRQHYIPQAPAGVRVTLNNIVNAVNETARKDFERAGYTLVRTDWHMEIEMHTAPAAPTWPQGMTLRTFVPGHDEHATFAANEEAFMDHWGHLPGNYAEWAHWMFNRDNFDPALWFLACDGPQIAGLSLCFNKNGAGLVDELAVRRPWRRKGVGMALLLQSFGEFYHRGISKVWLNADSQNLTGAIRLYTRAGMHVTRQFNQYQKELRPGVELSTQTISG